MKHNNFIFHFLVITTLLASCGPKVQATLAEESATQATELANAAATANASADFISMAQTVINQLENGNSDLVYALFDDAMRGAMSKGQLKAMWPQLEIQVGAFLSCTGYKQQEMSGYQVVLAICAFKAANMNMSMSFDSTGKIGGMYFKLAPSPTSSVDTYQPPAYVDKSKFTEQEVTVGSSEWALPGTLSIPNGSGPFPATVLVHGSGPNDRDETLGPNKPFRDLAWGLASRGIAVLRYDKRTLVHADLFTPDVLKMLTLQQETIDDALLAAALLRNTKEVDHAKVYVLGHSLGALAAPRIGQQDPELAGIIIMAAPTKPLEDVYVEQLTYIFGLDGKITADEQAQIDQAKAQAALVKSADLTVNTPSDELPLNGSGAYWLDLRNYHPDQTAAGLSMRIFILQGGRDYQVTPDNQDTFHNALDGKSNVTIKLYPDLNHLFMSGKGKSTPQEYNTPSHVEEDVIVDIANWITGK